MEPEMRKIKSIPIIGWLATRKFDKVMQTVPPKAVVQSFFRDSVAYNAIRADRIYDYDEAVVDIIDAEIVD
ncbi:MAG: hypothetical protein ACMXYL_00040 [Candidatus Woesearchaeota archaeon]